ncbi:hypothetical protein [Halomicrobium urmianum]|uniref:hypothetical protein n=1 Tax=Halomicrobium urmianum TaxID=1586233 RepID=UPI001CD9D0CF|nr:hypothetical protein [Halomicrobium urmianum]
MIETLIQGAAATITGTAAVAFYREGRRLQDRVDRHDRTLYGTEYRPGVVNRVEEIEEEVNPTDA